LIGRSIVPSTFEGGLTAVDSQHRLGAIERTVEGKTTFVAKTIEHPATFGEHRHSLVVAKLVEVEPGLVPVEQIDGEGDPTDLDIKFSRRHPMRIELSFRSMIESGENSLTRASTIKALR
jgi:hypothetical protein